MKQTLIGCLCLLVACSTVGQNPAPTIPDPEPSTSVPEELSAPSAAPRPIEETLKEQLAANLDLEPSRISVLRSSQVQFADSCLEVPTKDVRCAPLPVSGRIIILQAQGLEYEYHVTGDGLIVQPATRALDWTRTGGADRYCDNLTVFRSGEVYGTRCGADPDRVERTLADLLSPEERAQFRGWVREFGQIQLDASEPEGAADRLESLLLFYGSGDKTPGQAEEQEILHLAQNLFQRIFP